MRSHPLRNRNLVSLTFLTKTKDGFLCSAHLVNKRTGKIAVYQGGGTTKTPKEIILDVIEHPENFDKKGIRDTLASIDLIDFTPEEAREAIRGLETNFSGSELENEARQALLALKANYPESDPAKFRRADTEYMMRPQPPRTSGNGAAASGSIEDLKDQIDQKQARNYLRQSPNRREVEASLDNLLSQRNLELPEEILGALNDAKFDFNNPEYADLQAKAISLKQKALKAIRDRQEAASRVTAPAIPPVVTPKRIETERDALIVLTDTSIAAPKKASEDNPINRAIKYLIRQRSFADRNALLTALKPFKDTGIHSLYTHLVASIAVITHGDGRTVELIEALENENIGVPTKKIIAAAISQDKIPFENHEQISRAIAALSAKDYAADALKWLTTKRMSLPAEPAPMPDVDASISRRVETAFDEAFGKEPEWPVAAEAPKRSDTWRGVNAPDPEPAPAAAPAPEPAPQPAAPPKPLTELEIIDVLRSREKAKLSDALQSLSDILGEDNHNLHNPQHVLFALRPYADSDMDFIRAFSTTLASRITLLQQNAELNRSLQGTGSQLDRVRREHTQTKITRDQLAAEAKRLREAYAAQTEVAKRAKAAAGEVESLRLSALNYGRMVGELEQQIEKLEDTNLTLEEQLSAKAPLRASVEPLMERAQALEAELNRIIGRHDAAKALADALTHDLEQMKNRIVVLQQTAESISKKFGSEREEAMATYNKDVSEAAFHLDQAIATASDKDLIASYEEDRKALVKPSEEKLERTLSDIASRRDQDEALAISQSKIQKFQIEAQNIIARLTEARIGIEEALADKSALLEEAVDLRRETDNVQTALDRINGLIARISNRASDDKKA